MGEGMSYTPKPGDRVTSPLLVGEWAVLKVMGGGRTEVCRDGHMVRVETGHLTPVAPPLPPEPPVGSVVWDGERYWQRHARMWGSPGVPSVEWADLAADAVPVVPVTTAADWLDMQDTAVADSFRDEFGGFDE
jgi:hypothetical protein